MIDATTPTCKPAIVSVSHIPSTSILPPHYVSIMRVSLALLALALLALSVDAGLLFQRTTVPKGWVMLGPAPTHAIVNFTLGLRTQNADELESLFWAVSDPESEQYLQYPSAASLDERFGASPDDRSAVTAWLQSGGVGVRQIKHVSSSIKVQTQVHTAAKLFNTQLRQFKHNTTGAVTFKAWGAYSLPDAVHQRVELVTGISSFPVTRRNPYKVPGAGLAPTAPEAVIPQTVANLYGLRTQSPGSSSATQGVVEYEGQYFNNNDTAQFARDVNYNTTNTTIGPIPASQVIGTNRPSQPGVESSLDVQWMQAVNLEAATWFWIEDGTGWLYEFGNHILNVTNPPQVLSTSYGWWEGDQCAVDGSECQVLGVDSYGYTAAVNKLFQKIGLRGISLLVASGDSGANSRTDDFCQTPQLRPEFPASSPYVTTVGATQIVNGSYDIPNAPAICNTQQFSCLWNGTETAVSYGYSGFTSGGGFSNVSNAARPKYQDAAVTAYLNSGVELPPDSYYNAAGRGEPDVSAVGHNGYIVVAGVAHLVGGTSMSSPIFAAVIALLNEIALDKTDVPLGFLNPLLYKMAADQPSTFTDVTVGDNICTEYGCRKECKGYYAAPGWDPVTGLGTPNVTAMEAYITSLVTSVVERRIAKTTL